jgi:hypothetical protein
MSILSSGEINSLLTVRNVCVKTDALVIVLSKKIFLYACFNEFEVGNKIKFTHACKRKLMIKVEDLDTQPLRLQFQVAGRLETFC